MLQTTRVTETAQYAQSLSTELVELYARIKKFLNFNTTLNIAYTPATKVFTAANATDVCTSAAHGLLNGQKARLTNSGGALPAGLLTDTDYYLVAVATNTFQLSLTKGGAAVNFTDDGTGTSTLNPVPNYIAEETNGTSNMSGLPFDRTQLSSAIGTLTQLDRMMTNQTVTQGDHLGNLNLLARAAG
jgi:hypothetical protein